MDNFQSTPCEICGETSFYKDSGYFYCNECQTQSQTLRDHVFDNDVILQSHTAKRIQKPKSGQSEVILTSWECYSTVLLGLTKELINLGANKQLKRIVKLLWLKYLHKCEVFELESNEQPKVSILGSKKDFAILYNKTKKKRKRASSVASSGVSCISKQRQTKKRALIKIQYEELSQSQQQEKNLNVEETLHSLKSPSSEVSTERIRYNKFSKTELKRLMSKKHSKQHEMDVNDELTCHKLNAKSFRWNFQCGPTNLTSFTLYGLLYIGLLISGDRIQLGDLLRYIREGNLSFGCYKHFFDPEIPDKLLNLPARNEQLYSNGLFRKKCAKLAQFLDVSHFIVTPNFEDLSTRFCRELNLPEEFNECVKKLLRITEPKMKFKQNSQTIPNFEARIMSLILFCLKLFYGLDGRTEGKLNEFAEYTDELLNCESQKMFKILDWIQFICYRRNLIDSYHLPALLKDSHGKFDADLYLNYLKMQKIQFKGTNRHIRSEVKDYIQILEKVSTTEEENNEITRKFPSSLNPLESYVDIILKNTNNTQEKFIESILKENFTENSLKYILEPKKFLKSFGTKEIVHGGANDNIKLLDLLYLYKETIYASCRDKKKIVAVKLCKNPTKEHKNVLKNLKKSSLKTTDIKILIANWNKGHAKEFAISAKNLLDEENTNDESKKMRKKIKRKYFKHYNAYERYWINLPINPTAHYLGKQQMDKIAQNFPDSFRNILIECAKILEQDLNEIYAEFLITEIYLTNLNKGNSLNELKRTLKSIKENW